MQEEKKLVLVSFGEERIGRAQTVRNESEEESFRDVDPHIIRVGVKRREEVESLEKDKPYLTKMMPPPLGSMISVEKIPDWEWVPSDRRAENPGIRKINLG